MLAAVSRRIRMADDFIALSYVQSIDGLHGYPDLATVQSNPVSEQLK